GHHRYLHSFPTRRSSDLLDAHTLQDGEAGAPEELVGAARRGGAHGHDQLPEGGILVHEGVADLEPGVEADLQLLDALLGTEVARSEEHTSELQSRENLVC